MRAHVLAGIVSLAALTGCGLEGLFSNVKHDPADRPASTIRGAVTWQDTSLTSIGAVDGTGNSLAPFDSDVTGGGYEVKLPSARYSMARVEARAGDFVLRSLVPFVGEESLVEGVDLDPRQVTETLLLEARLTADGEALQLLTPAAYVGDGATSGTRTAIRAKLDQAGPIQDLLHMVERIMARGNPIVSREPGYFLPPRLDATFTVLDSPLDDSWLLQNPFDYDGVAGLETDSTKFDAKLAEAAQLFEWSCPSTSMIRLVFSVDFNAGAVDGNCATLNRFKWATDKPGKRMFFVGWIHEESEVQDPALHNLFGGGIPNQIQMYDDGTNGDEVSGDNIWTVAFDVPVIAGQKLRVGYKYTWGTRGAPWTGSEEWPGNSRLLQIQDVNGDAFVHRRDVFGDEATNKDKMNLNQRGNGIVSWDTVVLGAAAGCVDDASTPLPEAREQKATLHSACVCTSWITPQSIGPITEACPVGP